MKLKRFALRGLIILFVTVALCMFFARTVQTITTPKVQLVSTSSGRFETTMKFSAQVSFPEKEEIIIEEAEKTPITVDRIYVKPGHFVKAGDTIFTAKVPSFESEMEKLRNDYDAKNKELIELDARNRTLSKESRQNELYDEMIGAQTAAADAVYDARFLALSYDIRLTGDVSGWTQQLGVYEEVPEDVTKAVKKAQSAQSAYEAAKAAYFEILDNRKLRVRDDVFEYIKTRNAAIAAMEELTTQMIDLASTANSLTKVVAPHDGYIVSIEVSEGGAYDGSKKAYVISKEGSVPVLLADIDRDSQRTIADGTRADIESETYGTRRSEVIDTVINADASKQLRISIPEEFLSEDSAAIRRFVSDGGVTVSITYRARQSSTLIPASAIHNDGDGDYVYLIRWSGGGFMSQSRMTVEKTKVTVLDRNDTVVSISEDYTYQQLADREDRGLTDKMTVMEYVQ
ncbi:MAG: hypothetical protein J1E43_10450 [Christensenellaceae bacterium]|nr:hypothetical protein [Christensenellaceae bacterium]